MNLNTKSFSKSKKREILLEYVKNVYLTEKRFVSKREIRKKFHVELYNYFKNIFDMYQQVDIDVPLCFCPNEYAKRKIVEYVQKRVKEGIYPGRIKLDNKLGIHVYSYFKSIEHLYEEARVDYNLHIKKVKQDRFHSNEKVKEQRQKIVNYIKKRNSEGYFVGVHEIQNKLSLSFYKYFKSPRCAYMEAKINYERVCPTILGKNKENILTKIALHLLVEMGYTIKRTSIFDNENFNRGPDIELLDKDNNEVLVEIKAYHKRYWITTREIRQLENYMKNRNVKKGIFITTASKVNHSPKNIMVVNSEKLIELLQSNYLEKFIKTVKWIQEEKVSSTQRELAHQLKKYEVIKYVASLKKIPSQKQIEKNLRVSLKTYFTSPPYKTLINEIKINNGNDLLCKDPQ